MKPLLIAFLTLSTLLGIPAGAQPDSPLTGAEFERYSTGKTLYFGLRGEPYGVEQYFEDRRVRWSFLDGRCLEGEWYEAENRQICFIYEDDPTPHCWQFFLRGSDLIARLGDNPENVPLYQAEEQDDPMMCMGPDVGV